MMEEAEDMSTLQKLRPNLSKLVSTGKFCWNALPQEPLPQKSNGTKMENLCTRTKNIKRKCSLTMDSLFSGMDKEAFSPSRTSKARSAKSSPKSAWTVLQKKMQVSMNA